MPHVYAKEGECREGVCAWADRITSCTEEIVVVCMEITLLMYEKRGAAHTTYATTSQLLIRTSLSATIVTIASSYMQCSYRHRERTLSCTSSTTKINHPSACVLCTADIVLKKKKGGGGLYTCAIHAGQGIFFFPSA